jgi:hypothetical protein
MHVIEIAGANFHAVEPDSWERLSAVVSLDGSRLACVYRVSGSFRVQRFVRGGGAPQWQVEWWHEHQGPSITDTQQHADNLAMEHTRVAP